MRRFAVLSLSVFIIATLAGSAYGSPQEQEAAACRIIGPKAVVGAAAGAAGGAAIGGAAGGGRGALIGAGVGLFAGGVAGHLADTQDCEAAQAALKAQLLAARANSTIDWTSQSGHTGRYQAVGATYAGAGGAQCRRANSLPAPGSGDSTKGLVVCRAPNGDYSYTDG